MTEKQRKGIDFVMKPLMRKFPWIIGWVGCESIVTMLYLKIDVDRESIIKSPHSITDEFRNADDWANVYYSHLTTEYQFTYSSRDVKDEPNKIMLTINEVIG